MNKVISNYFDDAHRGLQRQQSEPGFRGGEARSGVQLPPLAGDAGTSPVGAQKGEGMARSSSMGAFDVASQQRGVDLERCQKVSDENIKISRKLHGLQEQLAITSAKKEAFRAQSLQLEREFRKGRDQAEHMQRELLEAKQDAEHATKEAQEALQMMSEMRKAHIQEVRLLQRGLAARGGDEKFRNRINEVADLVDKLGRAVVQRDEAIRDKTKMQAELTKTMADLRAIANDHAKLKTKNKKLGEALAEARRRGKFTPPKPEELPEDDSDPEFEQELSNFERRFQILEEGPAGLDILASNLSRDKTNLEKRLKMAGETQKSLHQSIESWKAMCDEKDHRNEELEGKVERMMREQAALEEQIAQKRNEIAQMVAEEQERLRLALLAAQQERDEARATSDGMEKASDRLAKELTRISDSYEQQMGTKAKEKAEQAALSGDKPSGEKAVVTSAEQTTRTGEALKMEVVRAADGSVELHVQGKEGAEKEVLPVSPELVQEVGEHWSDLLDRVGVVPGPPRRTVISSNVGSQEVAIAPDGTKVILTVYKYDSRNFFLSGFELEKQRLVDVTILQDSLTPTLESLIDSCVGDQALFKLLHGGLTLDGDGKLHFGTATAESHARSSGEY